LKSLSLPLSPSPDGERGRESDAGAIAERRNLNNSLLQISYSFFLNTKRISVRKKGFILFSPLPSKGGLQGCNHQSYGIKDGDEKTFAHPTLFIYSITNFIRCLLDFYERRVNVLS